MSSNVWSMRPTRDELAAMAHEIYRDTARRLDWKMKPEIDVPFALLSPEAQALDYALVDFFLSLSRSGRL